MRIALGGGNWEFNLVLLDKWGTVGMAMGLPRLQLWAYVQWVLGVAWAESNKFGVHRTYVCTRIHTYVRMYTHAYVRTCRNALCWLLHCEQCRLECTIRHERCES